MINNYFNKKIILSNDKEYQVIYCTLIDNKKYMYLINPNDYSDILFAELIYDDTLRLLDEKKEIYTVIANIDGQINTFFR